MGNIIKFKIENNVEELLTKALKEDLEEVVMVGIKDNKVYLRSSYRKDTLIVLGALTAATDHILKTWG